jgi:hypothetical protein
LSHKGKTLKIKFNCGVELNMRTKNTALATAIAISLATGGFVASNDAWADTSTRTLQTVIDRTPADDGYIYIRAGETINVSLLGLNQTGIVDTLGEQYGAILFGAINTQKGEIFAGSDTPGERFQDDAPVRGDFEMAPPDKKPFNNLKYVRMVQGLGRAYIFYPPNTNTPPIMDRTDDENREYDECCFLPCGEKIPEGVLNCPTDEERQDIVLSSVEDTVKITLQERFANTVGGVEYKVIQSLDKKIRILPAIPRVSKLEIVNFEPGPRETARHGERQAAEVDPDVCIIDGKPVHAKNHGMNVKMTAGVEGAKVTIWALKAVGAADRNLNDPNNCLGNRGLAKEDTANGRLVLKLVAVAGRTEYMRLPTIDMLNGEAQAVLPADITKAGKYYLEAELYLAVNGDVDPNSDMALPNLTDNVDMFTADIMEVLPTGKPKKLKLTSVKKVISDDANPPQNTPFNAGAAKNAATGITAVVLDEYGNVTALPQGAATKVKVVDEAGVLNSGSLNLDFAAGGMMAATDILGDNQGDVLRLGEASLVASFEGNPSIAGSEPLKIKVVAKNLVAAPYVGSPIAGDTAYGDPAGVLAADGVNRYIPNTVNVVKDIQAGTQVKAFSVGVDGGRTNGIPNGMFDFYKDPVGAILPNLVDGVNSDDDFVSRNSTTTLVIKTPAGEEIEAGVAQPVLDAAGNVQEIVQADGTRGQGARIDTLFTKPVVPGAGKYFVIGDKAGQYGETIVNLPGDIKPSAASKAKILNAHGFEDVVLGKDGKPVLDENGNPIIALDAQLDYPEPDGTHQLLIPQDAVKLGDEYGNPVSSAAAGTFTPGTSNGQPAIVTLNEYGEPVSVTGMKRTIRQAAGNLVPGGDAGNGNTNAYLLSYNSEEFAGTDRISFGFTSPGVKPRTVEVTIPQKPQLTTVKTEVEQTTLPVNSEIAITIRSLDQHSLPIDGLGNTTVSFTGTILQTATVWRMEDERRDPETGNLTGIDPLSSGDVIRPGGGDQQVLIMNIGNKEGEFTINFNSPELPAGSPAQSITFKAVAVYTPPAVCSANTPDLCKDEESCTSAGGEWKDNKCAFATVEPDTKEACEDQGGIYATNECFPVMKDGKPSNLVAPLEAASSVDGGQYGDEPTKETAGFFGGVMITGTQGTGDRKTHEFNSNASTLLGDDVQLSGVIKIEDVDKGKKADIVVGGFHIYQDYPDGFTWYMMVGCAGNDFVTVPSCPSFGWQIKQWPYDQMGFPILSELEPLKSITFDGVPGDKKDQYVTVDMFKGNFSLTANPAMQIYFGYIVTEGDNRGKVVYSGKPIEVKIEAKASSAGKDTAKDTEKDTAKDTGKDTAKDTEKDTAKDTEKDTAKDTGK